MSTFLHVISGGNYCQSFYIHVVLPDRHTSDVLPYLPQTIIYEPSNSIPMIQHKPHVILVITSHNHENQQLGWAARYVPNFLNRYYDWNLHIFCDSTLTTFSLNLSILQLCPPPPLLLLSHGALCVSMLYLLRAF